MAGMMGVAAPVANLISGHIYASGGNLAIWITALSLYACALLYVLFGFKDSRGSKAAVDELVDYEKKIQNKQTNESAQCCGTVKEICTNILRNLWKSFHETLRKREGYKRARIWILISITCILFFSNGTVM